MSTPSSSALVATTPRISPSRRPFSIAQVAAAVAAHPRPRPEILAERLAQGRQHDLDRGPAAAEDDGLTAGPEERHRPAMSQGQVGAAGTRRDMGEGRFDEQDVPLARRRAVPVDQDRRPTGEGRRQLGRVGDRRRAAHDHGLAAVVSAQPEEPPDHVRHVAAEHAAVRVELVDDDDLELLEQLEPFRMVGEDRRVEHVRVRDDDLACAANGGPDRGRRVAVVGRRRDRQAGGRGQLRELGHLVLAKGLGRKQEQRPRRRVLGDRLERRQRVAQRLARRRRRHDDDVAAGPNGLDRLGLMGVQAVDAARRQARPDPRIQPIRVIAPLGLAGRHHGVVGHPAGKRWLVLEDRPQNGLGRGRGIGPHRVTSKSNRRAK
jgi:hypothetical protein